MGLRGLESFDPFENVGWRLFQNRLPTKDDLSKRGVNLSASLLCVEGCGKLEGGIEPFYLFKGLVNDIKKAREMLVVIWFRNISIIWKARSAMIFNQEGFNFFLFTCIILQVIRYVALGLFD